MHRFLSVRPWTLVAALVVLNAVGCGGDKKGPARYQVSGNVTFGGAPLPAGTIIFEPDTSRGNNGPQGTARITDGKFDTAKGAGVGITGGPMIVRISGMNKELASTTGEPIIPLFNDFEVREEFPKSRSTRDYVVPKAAADAMPPGSVRPSNMPPE